MRGYDLWKSQREKAEIVDGGLRVLREDGKRPCVMVWNPKATKPYANFSFKTAEQREQYIAEQIANHKGWLERKAQYKAERAGKPEDLDKVQVGDIFCNSWGYDQTNVDYYQVIAKSGKSVKIREIACESIPGSEGFMSDQVKPKKDAFLENAEPIWKRIAFSNGEPYLSFKFGSGSKVKENGGHYRSWYA